MKRLCNRLLPSIVALNLAAPSLVLAQAQGGDPMLIYRQVGASSEQQSQIRSLADAFENGAHPRVVQAKKLMKQLQDYSLEPMPDEDTVFKTQNELNQLQIDMSTSRLNLMFEIRKILTPEQRVRLVKIMKERKAMAGRT